MKYEGIIGFLAGSVAGFFIGRLIFKKKYEDIANEEIESVKRKLLDYSNSKEEVKSSDNSKEGGYTGYANQYKSSAIDRPITTIDKEEINKAFDRSIRPYMINPRELGDCDYEIQSLTYFKDKVLADEDGNIINNIAETVGYDSLAGFGKFEEDSVCVRNDGLTIDYEILLNELEYSEVFPNGNLTNEYMEGGSSDE